METAGEEKPQVGMKDLGETRALWKKFWRHDTGIPVVWGKPTAPSIATLRNSKQHPLHSSSDFKAVLKKMMSFRMEFGDCFFLGRVSPIFTLSTCSLPP